MIRLTNLKLNINQEKEELLPKLISKNLNINISDIIDYRIFKESVDARKQDMIYFTYTVDVKLKEKQEKALINKGFTETPELDYKYPAKGEIPLKKPPVIVGSGPAGIFCTLVLSQLGYNPILIERGEDVDKRTESVNAFWEKGKLNPESNVQFGEGGAGTFSDGKLTTLIKDKRCRKILEEMVQAGAPKEILFSHKPHVGTDILKGVIRSLRKQIVENGGQVLFNTRLENIHMENSKVTAIQTNTGIIETEILVLALGHSARDTFQMLYQRGLTIEQKAFSIGVRVEHPQRLINEAQYKKFANHPKLGAADYKLAYHSPNGRSAYTFCMCPGGMVVASSSEEGMVVTNGMSEHARDGENANSALLVGITPKDFESDHPLAGIEFQRKWERKAFELGGRNYNAPAQLIGDFLDDKPSTQVKTVKPTYKKNISLTNLKDVLPEYIISTLKEAIVDFDRKIKGFANPHGILTGVETRSSSPIRIIRNGEYQSNVEGIYPCGEGAGYAGGIISAGVDGVRIAEAIISKYK